MDTIIYKYNEKVTLTATDTECCSFDYWALSDDPCKPVSYDNPLVISAKTNVSYVAKFKKKKFTVNVSTSYPGIVIIEGNGVYNCGENVTITATYPNCLDIYWSDSSLTPETSYYQQGDTVTLTYKIASISSDFYGTLIGDVLSVHVTVSPCPQEGGDVGIVYFPSLQNNNLSCNSQSQQQWSICEHSENGCSVGTEGDFMCGDVITLIARPNTDDRYVFNGWSTGDCEKNCNGNYISTNPIYTINACSDTDYIACFSNEEPPVGCYTIRMNYKTDPDFCYIVEIECSGITNYVVMKPNDVLHYPGGCNIRVHTYQIYESEPQVNFPVFTPNTAMTMTTTVVNHAWEFGLSSDSCCSAILFIAKEEVCLHGLYELQNADVDIVLDDPEKYIDSLAGLNFESGYPVAMDQENFEYIGDYFCNIPSDYLGCQQTPTPPPVVDCLSLRVLIDKKVVVNDFCYIVEISCGVGKTNYISLQTGNTLHFPEGCHITIHTYYSYKKEDTPEAPQISINGVVLDASYVTDGVLFTENNRCCIPTYADNLEACIHGVYNLGSVTNNVSGTASSFIDPSGLPVDTDAPPFFDSNNDYTGDMFCDVFEKEYIGCYQDNIYPK